MFGLMTVAKHKRLMAEKAAEIAALRPLAEKHLRSLANLKQNKSRTLA